MSCILQPTDDSISRITSLLSLNELVILPKESVYNFVVNINDIKNIKRIYSIKKRNNDNPLTVNVADFKTCLKYSDLTKIEEILVNKLTEEFWPGQLAIVCKAKNMGNTVNTTKNNSISFTSPSNQYFRKILDILDIPLLSTSANISGQVSCSHIDHITHYFKNIANLTILDNITPTKYGTEGTILKIERNEITILRQGYPSITKIKQVVNLLEGEYVFKSITDTPIPHGVSKSHYTINKKIKLANFIKYTDDTLIEKNKLEIIKATEVYLNKNIFIDFNKKNIHLIDLFQGYVDLSESGDIQEAIFNLYNVLHQLANIECDHILLFNVYNNDSEFYNIMNDRVSKICDSEHILIPLFN